MAQISAQGLPLSIRNLLSPSPLTGHSLINDSSFFFFFFLGPNCKTLFFFGSQEDIISFHLSLVLSAVRQSGALLPVTVRRYTHLSPAHLTTTRYRPLHPCTDGLYRTITAAGQQWNIPPQGRTLSQQMERFC